MLVMLKVKDHKECLVELKITTLSDIKEGYKNPLL
jgi:hypothetical protein